MKVMVSMHRAQLSDLRALACAMRRGASLMPFVVLVTTRALTYATPPAPLLAPGWHAASLRAHVQSVLTLAGLPPERRLEVGSAGTVEGPEPLAGLAGAVSRPGSSAERCPALRDAPAGPVLAFPERQPRAPPLSS